ncbi:putative MFS family arabinose efflux permease [Kribbella voronezhensis]|uniref:Putative MFS family arabinose efflux permease n=1 Tax=Kribbella voronezhensis TaxID=2512212 RepID=A0A4R7TH05_9ACTN|nr:MFS transporter [Kribbella voronezhensis]TDU91524.1 putative MFS family arabinose efflux permease [Kribbella voronezhensis]
MGSREFRLWQVAVPAFGPTVLNAVGQGAVLPVVALSALQLGASVGFAAFLVGVLGIGQFAGSLPAGALVVRIGERRALLVAAAVSAVAWAGAMLVRTPWLLGIALLVAGLAGAVFSLARQSYVTEVVPLELRARALSTLGGVSRIGLFIGPFLGAAAGHFWGLTGAYGVGVAGSVGAGVVLLAAGEPESIAVKSEPQPIRKVLWDYRRTFLTLGAGVFVIAVARAARTSLIPLWGEHIGLSATDTSIVFGITNGIEMLLFYPAGLVMDRFGRVWIAVPSTLLLGVGMLTLPFSTALLGVLAVAVLMAVGNGLGSGIVKTLGADAAPAHLRAQFLGGWTFCAEFGSVIGPILISAITFVAPLAAAAVALGAVTIAGTGWLARWVPYYDPRKAATSASVPMSRGRGVRSGG